ncbi:hypothetical protein [Actinomadura madurae]|uniref:hypothetical protein n=1 Tax=Actinomadura madurae TaxID=1993 RepID=UPI0020D20479|nr:hypothetical protein [Actinomadura madurae]MCQ0010654.1 hypothetical protein [Actinomadura madurae]
MVVPEGGAAAFLAPYPPAVLDRPDLADLLRRLGIRTLGDFAALPSGHVAGRFGADGALAHRLARGEEPRPLAPVEGAADLSVRAGFDPPAEQAERVVFAAKRLAGELHEGLAAGGLACVRLEVAVGFAGGHVLRRLWRHDGLSALAVAERVRWQLSAHDPAGTGGGADAVWGGVTWVELAPDQLVPDEGRQEGLWGRTAVTDRIARAADRVQALLGHHGITRPVLVGGRGPGERVVRVPVGDVAPAGPAGGTVARPGVRARAGGRPGGAVPRRAGRRVRGGGRGVRAVRGVRAARGARGPRAARRGHRLDGPVARGRALVGPRRRAAPGPVPGHHRGRRRLPARRRGRALARRGRL